MCLSSAWGCFKMLFRYFLFWLAYNFSSVLLLIHSLYNNLTQSMLIFLRCLFWMLLIYSLYTTHTNITSCIVFFQWKCYIYFWIFSILHFGRIIDCLYVPWNLLGGESWAGGYSDSNHINIFSYSVCFFSWIYVLYFIHIILEMRSEPHGYEYSK